MRMRVAALCLALACLALAGSAGCAWRHCGRKPCRATCACSGPVTEPARVVLPYEWIGDIDKTGFNEPSGIVWHPGRGTLFVIGDEGELAEFTTDGERLQYRKLDTPRDLEAITVDPGTGLLYVGVEGEERIFEVDPATLEPGREWQLPREQGGIVLFRDGGQGIESLTFVPDAKDPEGGTFYVGNQTFEDVPEGDQSFVVQVELPLVRGGDKVQILSWFHVGFIDIGAMTWDPGTGHLLLVGDALNVIMECTTEGDVIGVWALTGDNQEGVTLDGDGMMYIAQDTGGIIKFRPLWPHRRE
jgi:uncharacterized protein YjiK